MAMTEPQGRNQSVRQVVAASFIGTTIEWYDFFLYGTAAALVFNKLFFPEAEPSSGTLLALATYGVGFAARPLGGIIFGHFGDRIGRKAMLVLSLLIMGVATFLIGLMPTYDAIGIWAPIILVALRIAQGIGVGGEWGGAVLMSVEHAPRGRRGFYGSWPQMGVPAGLFLSTVVFLIVQETTSDEAFLSWGWRVPFLLSAVLIAVGLFVRLRLYESPAFQRVKDTGTEAPMPILDVLRKYPREVLLAMGMRIAENRTFYILTVWVLVYGNEHLKLPNTPAGLRDVAGQGVIGARERPPLIIRRCENNQRSDGGRGPQHRLHPLAGRPPGAAGPHRRPVRPGGAPAASQRVRARPAGRPTTQELLDDQRARRGSQPRWHAAPAQPGGLGCRRGA